MFNNVHRTNDIIVGLNWVKLYFQNEIRVAVDADRDAQFHLYCLRLISLHEFLRVRANFHKQIFDFA